MFTKRLWNVLNMQWHRRQPHSYHNHFNTKSTRFQHKKIDSQKNTKLHYMTDLSDYSRRKFVLQNGQKMRCNANKDIA